ncbi:hypothetical protein DSP71_19430 [Microbacterium sp. H6]|nr:hypothetical protein DSP71_19430 [Microbacterium sp. H6]
MRAATISDMEIAGFVVALVAALGAAVAALYAGGANRRADEANRTAEKALDLQARIDAREREFREVMWECDYALDDADNIVFRVQNTGFTDARQATAVFWAPNGTHEIVRAVGDVAAGAFADVRVETEMRGQSAVEVLLLMDTPWRMHWSSPLGHAETFKYSGLQLH